MFICGAMPGMLEIRFYIGMLMKPNLGLWKKTFMFNYGLSSNLDQRSAAEGHS